MAQTQEELKAHYDHITKLYALAEEMVSTVEHKTVTNQEEHMDVVQPMVEQVAEAATTLTEEYIVILENGQRPVRNSKSRVEGALRKIYVAIDDYKKRAHGVSKQTAEKVSKLVDPIVEKVKNVVEKTVTIFAAFIQDLSLSRIMHHTDIERFRKNQPKVALMLHSASQGH